MLERELGKDVALEQRAQFLEDNCDAVEEVTYSKMFTPEELAQKREQLTDSSIKIADIEEELKVVKADFKERLKPPSRDEGRGHQSPSRQIPDRDREVLQISGRRDENGRVLQSGR